LSQVEIEAERIAANGRSSRTQASASSPHSVLSDHAFHTLDLAGPNKPRPVKRKDRATTIRGDDRSWRHF